MNNCAAMTITFLDLPTEVRLQIYSDLFKSSSPGSTIQVGNASNQFLLPLHLTPERSPTKSSQILQTCSTVLFEARPILYDSTTIEVRTNSYGGRLPTKISDGFSGAHQVKKLVWNLNCDLLMRSDFDEIKTGFNQALPNLDYVGLHVRVDTWCDGACVVQADPNEIAIGHQQVREFALLIARSMAGETEDKISIAEDERRRERGWIILKLERKRL